MKKHNSLYNSGHGYFSIQQTRMRLGLSGLRQQLYDKHIVNNPTCMNCSLGPENVIHYLLICPDFNLPRIDLLNGIFTILPINFIINLTQERLVQLLLSGNSDLDFSIQFSVFRLVQTFILHSKRF